MSASAASCLTELDGLRCLDHFRGPVVQGEGRLEVSAVDASKPRRTGKRNAKHSSQ
jgi:hypothetical protein